MKMAAIQLNCLQCGITITLSEWIIPLRKFCWRYISSCSLKFIFFWILGHCILSYLCWLLNNSNLATYCSKGSFQWTVMDRRYLVGSILCGEAYKPWPANLRLCKQKIKLFWIRTDVLKGNNEGHVIIVKVIHIKIQNWCPRFWRGSKLVTGRVN